MFKSYHCLNKHKSERCRLAVKTRTFNDSVRGYYALFTPRVSNLERSTIELGNITGMDKTCLYTSSGSLFVILSVGMSDVHVTSNVIIT